MNNVQNNNNYVYYSSSSLTFKEEIETLKNNLPPVQSTKTIVISGGGPAGLMSAIAAIANGNPVKIIEKRDELAEGRENVVALKEQAIDVLKQYGVYTYLMQNGLARESIIENVINLSVSIKDLEKAIKAVIAELRPGEQIFYYNSQIEKIDRLAQNILEIKEGDNNSNTVIDNVGTLVVSDGAHSKTLTLLGARRTRVIPLVDVVIALGKNEGITSFLSFFSFVGRNIAYLAVTIYYHTLVIFKLIFQADFRQQKQLVGVLNLSTPTGQLQTSYALSASETQKMTELKIASENAERELNSNPDDMNIEKARLAKNKLEAYLKYWAGISLASANCVSLVNWLRGRSTFSFSLWRPFTASKIVPVGADKVNRVFQKQGNTLVIYRGDALVTVDPATGLGCTTAISSTVDFLRLIRNDIGIESYKGYMDRTIESIHQSSEVMRRIYRPDALF